MDFFLKVDFFGFFRGLYIRKFRENVSDDFYDKKNKLFTKKFGNLGISSETTIPGISSETRETRAHIRGCGALTHACATIVSCSMHLHRSFLIKASARASSALCRDVREVVVQPTSGIEWQARLVQLGGVPALARGDRTTAALR